MGNPNTLAKAINTSASPFLTVEDSEPIKGAPILIYGASLYDGVGNQLIEKLMRHIDFDNNTLYYSKDFAFTEEFVEKLHKSNSEKIYLNYAIKYGVVVFIIDEHSNLKKGALKPIVHKMLHPKHTETQYVFHVCKKCRLSYQKSDEVMGMYSKGHFGYEPTDLDAVVDKIKTLHIMKTMSNKKEARRVPLTV